MKIFDMIKQKSHHQPPEDLTDTVIMVEDENWTYEVELSMLEIYNDKIVNLLSNNPLHKFQSNLDLKLCSQFVSNF